MLGIPPRFYPSNWKNTGISDAAVVAFGYATVSWVFAIAMINAGLPPWLPIAMCVFVYAGAAQFAVLSLLAGGASIAVIVMTTFTINLRHMLMSIYLSRELKTLPTSRKQRWLYGMGLTDESFAVHSEWFRRHNDVSLRRMIIFNFICHSAWVFGAILGVISAVILGRTVQLRLDYALTAMMLYVLASLCRSRLNILAALCAVAAVLLLKHFAHFAVNSSATLLISTFIACMVSSWMKRSASR